MSREVIIRIRDDVDGSDADETIAFAYRGESYEIDLSSANVERLDKTMKEWLDVARQVQPIKPVAKSSVPPSRRVMQQRARIRDWANSNGFSVYPRGMIAADVIAAFLAANPDVTLLPGTSGNYQRAASGSASASATSVSAQDADEGLISASELLDARYGKRDRRRESVDREKRDVIRAWGIANGFDQALTGRIKAEVVDAYNKEHES